MEEQQQLKPLILNPPINPTLVTDGAGLEKLRQFFANSKDKVIGWDKETPPLKDFFWRRDRTWQFGNLNEQYVIDLLAFVDGDADLLQSCQGYYGMKMSPKLQPVLDIVNPIICNNEFTKVGVNLGFEYEQSYWNFGQRTWGLYGCDMVERCIWAGAHSLKDYDFFSMASMFGRYFGCEVKKELQTSFNLTDPLTPEQIEYAALDTRLPLAIRLKQLQICKRDRLMEVAAIENNAIGSFIDMHVHGQNINRDKWKARTEKQKTKLQASIDKLDEIFLPLVGSKSEIITDEEIAQLEATWKAKNVISDRELELKKLIKAEKDTDKKLALLAEKDQLETERKEEKERLKKICSERKKKRTAINKLVAKCEGQALINYGSKTQVYDVLVGMKGLGKLESTNDDDLEKFAKHPAVAALRSYREHSKQVSTYGETWYTEWTTGPGAKHDGIQEGWLHPGDGRLHSKFNQYDAETGRSTSSQPNGQNLPQDKELRSCFEADPPDENIRISVCCDEEAVANPTSTTGYSCPKCGQMCETKAEEYCIVTADMSGAELRIIAELANAKTWIEAFARDEDVHSVGTELLYPEKWPLHLVKSAAKPDGWYLADVKKEKIALVNDDGTPVLDDEGKQKYVPPCAYYALREDGSLLREKCKCPIHEAMRNKNKSTNFLLAYGGTSFTLAQRIGSTREEADELMALHEKTFPDIWAYLDRSGKEAKFNHEARSMFDRRRQFPEPNWKLATEGVIADAKSDEGGRWEKVMRKDYSQIYGKAKWDKVLELESERFAAANGRKPKKEELYDLTHVDKPLAKHISSYLKGMHERIERQGKNHCIQSTNADIAKLAMGCGYDTKEGKPFLWHTLPLYKAKLLAFVHDELIVQCPKRFGEAVAALIGDAFRRAAAEKMTKVIMKFDYHVAHHWMK